MARPGQQEAYKPALLAKVRRIVVKIGSSLLSTPDGIDHGQMERLVDEIRRLQERGYQIVVVSSGAVAAGLARLGLGGRPKTVPLRQAAAAIGQISLMALYEEYFSAHGHHVAQILLTHDDLADRRRYLNARHTFAALLHAGVIPIVNENDTVVVDEVKINFGDNDNLSALVATLVDADLLVILSDVAGLYTADPHTHPDAVLVELVESISDIESVAAGSTSAVGTGGMASKVRAAYKTTEAGIACIVADGLHAGVLDALVDPHVSRGTLFLPKGDRLAKRKHWIAHTLKPAGAISVDHGAFEAITAKGRSLLPKGVAAVSGTFGAGECVSCLGPDAHEFARGLVNYNSAELARIKGLHTSAIEGALGYKISDEVIHRDDLILL